ncbi:Xaa-Pro dipeptidyl-peptidase [Roseimaritima multifibrata]|uniref:Xaa-Pro dipeptidyl-peptidase n=1 Tax=Roseimaritima multifibrata TaxID=1930274 RepID=A0A517MD83_9BACT|nr:Xaa-Pro dipeptidyl-peptidase [Roseimaritima multifibrata]QDS92854.1 Xaa-Pro dipeptidyl-peptidase [Roseimaritima multifibrata]
MDSRIRRTTLIDLASSRKGLSLHFLLVPIAIVASVCLPGGLHAEESEAAAVPVFKDGEAQVVPAFEDPDRWIRHDLWVETEFDSDKDGKLDRVHVAVTRPQETEIDGLKLPVVYVTSPYFAGTAGNDLEYFWDPKHELGETPPEHKKGPRFERKGLRPIIAKTHLKEWVPRGYIVVHSSSPGTGLSQGCPTVGGSNESLAPKAVIDWLNGRAKGFTAPDGGEPVLAYWTTGKVGMTGTSYNGTLPLAAATTGVEGLEAIIPIAPNTSYYHYYRSNGLVRHPGGYLGEDIDVLYDFIHSGNPEFWEACNCDVRDEEMGPGMDRETGDYNDFWAGRDYLNQLEKLRAPVLMAHGFNDWNVVPEHSYRITAALKKKGNVPVQIYYHQGGHGGPPPMKMMNRWFTRYLHGIENKVEEDAKAWIVREADEKGEPTAYPDYPHPDAQPVELKLQGNAPEQGALTLGSVSPSSPATEMLVDNVSFDGKTLAKAESTNHRLIYVTPKLAEPVHLSGVARISVRVASSKPAANLSVWLVSLPWNDDPQAKITDNIITRGWADPQNQESMRSSQPLQPGQFYDVSFDLQPDDQIIPAGQQIGLLIMSSDREFTLWPKPGTELTFDLRATKLMLPVVGGEAAIKFESAAATE